MSSRSWEWRQECQLPTTGISSGGITDPTQDSPGFLRHQLLLSLWTGGSSTRLKKYLTIVKFEADVSTFFNGRIPWSRHESGRPTCRGVLISSRTTFRRLGNQDASSRLSSPVQCPKALAKESCLRRKPFRLLPPHPQRRLRVPRPLLRLREDLGGGPGTGARLKMGFLVSLGRRI